MLDRFGRFVLLGELGTSWRGTEYRAAALAGATLERLVVLLRLAPPVGQGDAVLDHLRAAAQLNVPSIVAVREIGRLDGEAFVASDLIEGKSLRTVLARSQEEYVPFGVDNALQVAERVAAALEYAHAHRLPGGEPFVHGLVGPDDVFIAYDGEVALSGFGWWTSRVWQGLLPDEDARRLAPEQREGGADPRSDVYGVGAVLLEILTGLTPGARLSEASLLAGGPLPPAIAVVLAKALHPNPAERYPDAKELRRAINGLLFSGDFSPTTFNLAYFMYTLFREVVEQEARLLEGERNASYAEPELPPPPPPPALALALAPAPMAAPVLAAPPSAPAHRPAPAASTPHHAIEATPAKAPVRTARRPPARSRGGLIAVLAVALLLVVGAASVFYYQRSVAVPTPPPETTLPPDVVAALARVRDLEDRLKAMEEEKAQAEAAASEQARQRLEAEAAAKGRAVDRAAVARAQEEAVRQARADQERRQQVETKKLEDEMRAQEERLAAARATATPSATPMTSLATLPPPPSPTLAASPSTVSTTLAAASSQAAPPTAAPAVAGSSATPAASTPAPAPAGAGGTPILEAGAPGVVAPVLETSPPLEYPLLAKMTRVEGVVVVAAVVDETGRVIEAKPVSVGNEILRTAAGEHVKKRRYRPGKKDGVPVRVRIMVQVTYKLQK